MFPGEFEEGVEPEMEWIRRSRCYVLRVVPMVLLDWCCGSHEFSYALLSISAMLVLIHNQILIHTPCFENLDIEPSRYLSVSLKADPSGSLRLVEPPVLHTLRLVGDSAECAAILRARCQITDTTRIVGVLDRQRRRYRPLRTSS